MSPVVVTFPNTAPQELSILHLAAMGGWFVVVDYMYKLGVCIDLRTPVTKRTPLQCACMSGVLDCEEALACIK